MNSRLPLAGIGVIVTRPARQADNLCSLLEQQGAHVLRFPTLEILGPRDGEAVTAAIQQAADWAIFTSANAVEYGIPLLQTAQPADSRQLKKAAIGKATAAALRQFDCTPDLIPLSPFNSEALLAMAPMQAVQGQKIIIFRGESGRELLADTLRHRGADVVYAEVYRRAKPNTDPQALIRRWERGEIHVAAVTSNESLQNFFEMLGAEGRRWLRKTPLVVISERTRDFANSLEVEIAPFVADEASDQAIVQAVLACVRQNFV